MTYRGWGEGRTKMSLKYLFAAISALFMLITCQGAASAEPAAVTSVRTPEHEELFDIPLLIKPAKGLTLQRHDGGCADKVKKVAVEASEVRVPYETLVQEFSETNLKKAGMNMKLRSEYIWNGSRATLLKIFQKSKTTVMGKWVLLIDRGEKSWIVNGLYDSKDQKRSEMVLGMLKSSFWEESPVMEQLEAAPLGGIKTDGTPMKLAGIRQGAFIYTKDGLIPTKHEDGAFFVVYRHLNKSLLMPEQRAIYARGELSNIEKGKEPEIISENTVQIDSLSGVEISAYTKEAKKQLLFVTLLFDGRDAIIMSGSANENTIENMDLFHRLSATYTNGASIY